MATTNQSKSEVYREIIKNIEALTTKMEAISNEYFEAHIEFISGLSQVDAEGDQSIESKLACYKERFSVVLDKLETQTKSLKRDKIDLQFRNRLLNESVPLS